MKHKICSVLKGPRFEDIYPEVKRSFDEVDLYELRLDLFDSWTFEEVKQCLATIDKPFLLTLRRKDQGGAFQGSEEEREAHLLKLAALKPEYIDIEYNSALSLFEHIQKNFPAVKVLVSYHNFQETPHNLETISEQLCQLPVDELKIVCTAKSSLDSLRMLDFLANYRATKKISAFCMGADGEFSRVLAPKYGSAITYTFASSSQQSATGQIDLNTLRNVYHLQSISQTTLVLGLIGDPVIHSKGIYRHNAIFQKWGKDAVYVRIRLEKEEVQSALSFMQRLGFKGLSVTMPLKESVVPYLNDTDEIVKGSQSANTVTFDQHLLKGANTDSLGAVSLLQDKVSLKDKKISFLGAGGTAKAIALLCALKGAKIKVYNRSLERAFELAHSINQKIPGCCVGDRLENYHPDNEDILIQATSKGMNAPTDAVIDFSKIPSKTLIFDIVAYPPGTQFLKWGLEKGCPAISGFDLFIEQAVEQYACWFGKGVQKDTIRAWLKEMS